MSVIPQNLIDSKVEGYGNEAIIRILNDKQAITGRYLAATQQVPDTYVDEKGMEKPIQPEFHLFCGAPGTGKTTLAQELVTTYANNLSHKNVAHDFGIVAFDFDEILKQMSLYQNAAGNCDENGLSQSDENTRIKAYEYARNASLYISDSLVNAMFENRRNFMYSIASSDGGAIKLAEGAQKAGYKVIVHVCDAPQHVYEQAIADRFARGDRYTDPKDIAEKPAKARNNMTPLLAMAERGHLYYRSEADAGLQEVAVFSGHLMIVKDGSPNSENYKAFVDTAGKNPQTFIADIRDAAGLDKNTQQNDRGFDMGGFNPKKYGW